MEEFESSEDLKFDGKGDGVVVDHKPVVVQGKSRRLNGPSRRCSKANWTEEEDDILRNAVQKYAGKCWKKIAECPPGRTMLASLAESSQKVLNPDLIKGPWSKEEDSLLVALVGKFSEKKWSEIAEQLAGRLGQQCRERWYNHLKPEINKAAWMDEEERILINAHAEYGNKWSILSKLLPGRTENSVKNHWNCSLKKKLAKYTSTGSATNVPRLITYSSPHVACKRCNGRDLSTCCLIRPRRHSDLYDNVRSSLHWAYTGLCYEPIQKEDLNMFLSTGKFPSSESYVCQPKRSKSVPPRRYHTKESSSCLYSSTRSFLRSAAMSYDNVPSIIRKRGVSNPDKVVGSLNKTVLNSRMIKFLRPFNLWRSAWDMNFRMSNNKFRLI